ncbi:MAG: pyridoxal-phosphate dependent enzyme [Dehalococcoidia bacterium]
MTPTGEDVRAAAERLERIAHRTPVVTSRTLDDLTGSQVFLKCENLQRAGAFKFRGAYNTISRLGDDERGAGIVTFSSGNHAQAVALAGSLVGTRATIFMPNDAPASKLAATESYGATIRRYDRLTEDRAALAAGFARDTGATIVPPFDHLGDRRPGRRRWNCSMRCRTSTLLVPVGGGGLLAGSLLAAAGRRVTIYGVEPEQADDTAQSLRAGHRIEITPPDTIADGLRPTSPGALTFPIIQRLAAGVLVVSEPGISEAVRLLLLRMKLLVEPSGAVGVAALLAGLIPRGRRVGVILSGGNIDPATLAAILGEDGA